MTKMTNKQNKITNKEQLVTSSIYVANCPRTDVSMLSSDSSGNPYKEL